MRILNEQPKQDFGEILSGGKSQQISEVKEMRTQQQYIQTGPITMDGISGINSENERGIEMFKTAKQNWFSWDLGNFVPVKLLAGLAVGALLMTAIGLPTTGVSADEPASPLINTKVESQGFGPLGDWTVQTRGSATVTVIGYGPLADIPTVSAKVEHQGFGPLDDVADSSGAARISLRQSQGYGPIEDMNIDAKLRSESAKLTLVGYGPLADIPTVSAKVERQGFGPLDDVATPVKVEHQSFGPLDDMVTPAKVNHQGFGPLDDVVAAQR